MHYINHYENTRNIHLILDNAGTQDLKSWLDSKKSKNKQGAKHLKFEKGGVLLDLFRQICISVNFLHENNLVHRDLKMENIVLCFQDNPHQTMESKSQETSTPTATLVDFGFSSTVPLDDSTPLICGTPNYMSPELTMKKDISDVKKGDSWALGVILYYLGKKTFPFSGVKETDLMMRILECNTDYEGFGPEATDLLKKIFEKNQHKRLSVSQILRHPLLQF